MECPECHARNRPNASFCIECGEPLELNNAPEGSRLLPLKPVAASASSSGWGGPFGGTPDRKGEDKLSFPASMIGWIPRPFNPLGWGLEVRITVVVLIVAIGADLLIQGNARSEASDYQRGLQAEQQKHWHDAATLLQPLAWNNYQDAAAHYKNVEQYVGEFDHYDNWGQGAKLSGAYVRAAGDFYQANQIEPGYDGVDRALTETLALAGQVLYQQRDGLYLANALGQAIASLPGSDAQSEVLAISSDKQYVAYTGFDLSQPPARAFGARPYGRPGGFSQTPPAGRIYPGGSIYGQPNRQVAQRKVYIRNLITGATETFDDVQTGDPGYGQPMFERSAVFVNNGKGLLLDVYRNDASSSFQMHDLYYFDIAANAGLRRIGSAYNFAAPDETDTHLYYTPVETTTFRTGDTIISYDLNNGRSNVIAHSNGNIDTLKLGGKLTDTPSTRVLYYVVAEDNSYRIYSKLPPDASTSTVLVDEVDYSAANDARRTDFATAPNSEVAIALKLGDKEDGWLLQPATAKATNLSDKGWNLLMNGPLYMQYSPDGSQVLVYGNDGQNDNKTWYAVVSSDLQLSLRPSWLPGFVYLQWMSDNRHVYSYSYSSNGGASGFSIIDTAAGKQIVFVARQFLPRSYSGLLNLLPDGNTILYAADNGVYISDVDGQYPLSLIPGASAAWLIPTPK